MTRASSSKMATKKPWKKVLYEKQNYPDNYTDPNIFLRDLRKNIDIKEVTTKEAILGATPLIQEFSTVVAFVLIYFYLINKRIEPFTLFYLTNVLTTIGFVVYLICYVGQAPVKEKLGNDLRTVLTFLVFGQLFSPVLHTLTDTISTDTIYTMVFLSMLVHLIFFDYGVSAAIVSKSLSLSAAIFASICLASRLPSADYAFIFMTIATEAFVLFPILRNEMRNSFVVTLVLLSCDVYCLYYVSSLLTVLFIATVIFINLVCPVLFVRYQKYKDNIYGPWDEAVVDDADSLLNF